MKRTYLFTFSILLILMLSSCKNNENSINEQPNDGVLTEKIQHDNTANSTPKNMGSEVAIENLPINNNNSKNLMLSLSPDKKVRLEATPEDDNSNSHIFKLIDVETNKVFGKYNYKTDSQFTVLWSEDSYYVAIGLSNQIESRIVILIAEKDVFTTGKEIVSGDLTAFTNSINSNNPDANIIPIKWEPNSLLKISIDWNDTNGNRKSVETSWDYKHGTYTKFE